MTGAFTVEQVKAIVDRSTPKASQRFEFQGLVSGELASKSNSRIRTHWGGFIKSDKARRFCKDFEAQIPKQRTAFEGPCKLIATVYYASRRPDLDISLLQDCIQKQGIIKNDRQIDALEIYKQIDKGAPRVHFRVVSL